MFEDTKPVLEHVSIILPYFNRSALLARAVESVLGQTHPDLTLYLINDGSTDNSSLEVRLIRDSRIVHIDLDRNRGVCCARNVGLDAAQTDLIAFMDSDDVWMPDKLKTQISYLRRAQETDPEISVIGCGWRYSEYAKLPQGFFEGPHSWTDVLQSRVAGIGTPMLLVDRSVAADTARFDPSFPALEDREFVLSCLENGTKVVVVPMVLAWVSRSGRDHLANHENAARGYERFLEKYSSSFRAEAKARSWYHFRTCREYIMAGHRGHALTHCAKALADQRLRRLFHMAMGLAGGRRGFAVAQRTVPLGTSFHML